jgi:hypothetical protein
MKFFHFQQAPVPNQIAKCLHDHAATLVIGHPTYKTADNIGSLIKRDIEGLRRHFPNDNAIVLVSDGTLNTRNQDFTVFHAVKQVVSELEQDDWASTHVRCIFTVYEGYAGNTLPGKGSALKLIFNEFYEAETPQYLFLFDGDIRNDISTWMRAYKKIIADFETGFGRQHACFVTAKYARHFVDASLTRFVVSPLTTLAGMFVPGGISGDILLNRQAVAHEVQAEWSESRYKYGTDIATTFDNIYARTVIYEAYLGAKLHDITDEAKLSVMPGEVIGSALERLLTYENTDHFLSQILTSSKPLDFPIMFDSAQTGIDFIDPGYTDVFDIKHKMESLITHFPDFQTAIRKTVTEEDFARLVQAIQHLSAVYQDETAPLRFMDMTTQWYTELVYQILARLLRTADLTTAKKAYQYLYTGAFLEFCKEKLQWLGCRTIGDVVQIQGQLGVPAEQAKAFYQREVDQKIKEFSVRFYAGRHRIMDFMSTV